MVISKSAKAALAVEIERAKAGQSFPYFLNFVKIVEPPQMDSGFQGGPIPFEKWPHLVEMAEIMPFVKLLVVLKARQDGFSWLVAAYVAWLTYFKKHSFVPMLSQGQLEAGDLLSKVKDVLNNLPEEWPPAVYDTDSVLEIALKDVESTVRALPSTEKAGRSVTATAVVIDEAEFQDSLALTMGAIKPTIDAGGQIIMGSTVNKQKARSIFKNIYRGASLDGKSGKNLYVKRFWGWAVRPGRNQEWYEQKLREMEDDEELGMDPRLFMEMEYPATEEEALRPSRFISAFDMDRLNEMWEQRREPIAWPEKPYMKVHQDFQIGMGYWAASDIGLGKGGDYSCTVILDQNGWIVADVMSNELEPDEFVFHSMQMLTMYNNPRWAIESNSFGLSAIEAAERASYRNLYKRKQGNGRVLGWLTNANTRDPMWDGLIAAVRTRACWVPSEDGLLQFYACMRDPKNQRVEAQQGAHDDYPTACAIAWAIRKEYPSYISDTPAVVGSRF